MFITKICTVLPTLDYLRKAVLAWYAHIYGPLASVKEFHSWRRLHKDDTIVNFMS